MKIRSITIKNFRGYKEPQKIIFNDITLIVGKNDVGKSTILEALDIFFGNRNTDKDDLNINRDEGDERIIFSVEFSDLPAIIDLDEGAMTELAAEYMLNSDGYLEVKKIFNPGSKTQAKVFLNANYPVGEKNLLILKNSDLKQIAIDLNINRSNYSASINNSIRRAIWGSKQITLEERDLEIDKEDGKQIYTKLEQEMPVFSLFSADRKNSDQDSEIQDPMKSSVKQIIKELEEDLNPIKNKVITRLNEIAQGTIQKLHEMNPEVAQALKPITETPSWDKAFSVTIESDGIPLNKRGSGVKRLVLINFFRNEAERSKNDRNKTNIVYAIEEPETSQHPDWQQKLFRALHELIETGRIQIILTSHHPELTSLVSLEDIRLIKKVGTVLSIKSNPEIDYNDVAKTLGILPRIDGVKVVVCVEGPHDVIFIKNIFSIFIDGVQPDDERILWIPCGGQTLRDFINEKYLSVLKIPQVHFYDGDKADELRADMDKVKEQGYWGEFMKQREIENYFHPKFYKKIWPTLRGNFVDISNKTWLEKWGLRDIPTELSEFIKQEFDSGNIELRNYGSGKIKSNIAENSKLMLKEDFKEMGIFEEFDIFFNSIKSHL